VHPFIFDGSENMKWFLSMMTAIGTLTAGNIRETRADEVLWLRSYEQAVETARRFQRPLLVYVTHPQCRFCRQMESATYADAGIVNRLNGHFVAVRIDASEQPDLAARLRVAGYPSTLIAGRDLRLVDRADGFVPPDSFAKRLDAVTGSP